MLYVPYSYDFQWKVSNNVATRPTTAMGTTITPGTAPTMGGWSQLISAATMVQDGYGILIGLNNGSTAATQRNYLVDIGVDNAGGTNYSVVIPYLLGGHSGPYTVGPIWYYFPLKIKEGSSIAARAMGNVTTTFNVLCVIYGNPTDPASVKTAQKIVSFGESTATALGTTITIGTTAEGAWTPIGSSTLYPFWYWNIGYTLTGDTNWTAQVIELDLAEGLTSTNPRIIFEGCRIYTTTNEQISKDLQAAGNTQGVAEGRNIYVRGQSSGTPDGTSSVMVYGAI